MNKYKITIERDGVAIVVTRDFKGTSIENAAGVVKERLSLLRSS